MPRVLRSRDAARPTSQVQSQCPVIPWDGQRTLEGCDAADGNIAIRDVVWADDIAVPRVCKDPRQTCAAIACETGARADSMSELGLRLTYGAGKTAAVATVRGAGSREVKQSLFPHDQAAGSIPLLREHAERAAVPLVASYRHLGTMQAPGGDIGPEIRYRVSQAHGALQEGRRKLYRSRRICVRRMAHLLNATVLAKLTHGAGAWPPLGKCDQQTFDTAVWTFSRAILCVPRSGDQSLTGVMCCALTGLLPPLILKARPIALLTPARRCRAR